MADDSGIIVLNVRLVEGALTTYRDVAIPELQAATERNLLGLVRELMDYPTEPEGSSYRRTGTLGRAWGQAQPEFQAMASGFEGTLGNATPYAPYVQGDPTKKPGQAKMHQGRWRNIRVIEEERKRSIIGVYVAANQRIAAKINRVTR